MQEKFNDLCCRKPFSRIGHAIFAATYLLIFLLSISSFTIFILKEEEVQRELPEDSEGHCILYVDEEQIQREDIGGGDFCGFAVFGMITVTVVSAIYCLVSSVKCLFGASLLSCAVLIEIPLLFCIMVISIAHSLNSTIGLALTCQAFVDAGQATGSGCTDYEAPGGTRFYDELLAAEVYDIIRAVAFFLGFVALSWFVTGTISVLLIVYIILGILFWKKATKPKKSPPADRKS